MQSVVFPPFREFSDFIREQSIITSDAGFSYVPPGKKARKCKFDTRIWDMVWWARLSTGKPKYKILWTQICQNVPYTMRTMHWRIIVNSRFLQKRRGNSCVITISASSVVTESLYDKTKKCIKSIGFSVQKHVEDSYLPLDIIEPFNYSKIPSWELIKPDVDTSLSEFKKNKPSCN